MARHSVGSSLRRALGLDAEANAASGVATTASTTHTVGAGRNAARHRPVASWKLKNPTLAQWERITEWPLLAAALLFLAAFAVPIIWPHLDHPLLAYTNHVIIGTWVLFGIDYLVRLYLAKNKWGFVKHNILDLASIILPTMRSLRILRLLAALAVLNRIGIMSLRGRVIGYALAFTTVITFTGALLVTQAERGVLGSTLMPNILTFRDGFWWAIVTVATVGYGDFFPVTFMGRAVAVVLMMTGVLLVGSISASLASWLVQHALAPIPEPTTPAAQPANNPEIDLMLNQIEQLNTQVTSLNDALQRHAVTLRSTQQSSKPPA